jgi:hypothetical protein
VYADFSELGSLAAIFPRADFVAGVSHVLDGFTATQHLSPNHVIEFGTNDPDCSVCHSCMLARHVLEGSEGGIRALLPPPNTLVVKDGANAATAYQDEFRVVVPALTIDVVEPVGAGDAFAAGFLASRLRGEPLDRSLRLGHLTAASALRVTGDHGPLLEAAVIEGLLAAPAHEWSAWSPSEHNRGVDTVQNTSSACAAIGVQVRSSRA